MRRVGLVGLAECGSKLRRRLVENSRFYFGAKGILLSSGKWVWAFNFL